MCGRFDLTASMDELIQEYGGVPVEQLEPCYNIAPSRNILVARQENVIGIRWLYLRWGLIPHWEDHVNTGYKLFNAVAETITEKTSFRDCFAARRCIIPATGFYEWKQADGGPNVPYRIRLKTGKPFAFAGIYNKWKPPEGGEPIESCSIITTTPNKVTRPIHDRMPVIRVPPTFMLFCTLRKSQKLKAQHVLGL